MKKNLLLIIFCFAVFIGKAQVTLVVAGLNETCSGSCNGQGIVIPGGGTPGYTYSWNTIPPQTTSGASGLCAGSYTVTVTDAVGSTATATVLITGPTPVVIAPITSPSICFGQSTTLTAIATGGNPGPYTYTWNGTHVGASYTVSPTATTTYTVIAADINGCSSAPATVTVTVSPPLATATGGTTFICNGSSTTISATGFGGNGGPYIYTWAPAGTGSSSSVSVSPSSTTTYTVTVNDGCTSPSAAATVTITVITCTGIQSLTETNSIVQIYPNPFTSETTIDFNADYKNATLKIIDVLGKELKRINFSGKQVILEREELKAGMYFIQIISENKIISTNKIIIN